MKRFLIAFLFLTGMPFAVQASYISGVDDTMSGREVLIPKELQRELDYNVLTYYQDPDPEKINRILDIIADSKVLDRKTAPAPMVGFLTVVFANNKNRVISWMSRNNYYEQAQFVIVNALMHAKLKESAMLFAKAHHWDPENIYRIRETEDTIDLKKLPIIVPGHIDTLWGAFFASGDEIYVDQIITAALTDFLPEHSEADYFINDQQQQAIDENRTLAQVTLKDYAKDHAPVKSAVEKRLAKEPANSLGRTTLELILKD